MPDKWLDATALAPCLSPDVGVKEKQIMKSKYQYLSGILVLMLFSSCSSMPVGWGGSYEVLQATDKSITIEYDGLMSSYKEILSVARIHCNKTGKEAVPTGQANTSRASGLITTHTFRCE